MKTKVVRNKLNSIYSLEFSSRLLNIDMVSVWTKKQRIYSYNQSGDLIFITSDGISDNFDPVVGKFCVIKKTEENENPALPKLTDRKLSVWVHNDVKDKIQTHDHRVICMCLQDSLRSFSSRRFISSNKELCSIHSLYRCYSETSECITFPFHYSPGNNRKKTKTGVSNAL